MRIDKLRLKIVKRAWLALLRAGPEIATSAAY